MQLELFAFEDLSLEEVRRIHSMIRNSYWHIRNLRGGAFGQARLRKHYRIVAGQKKRLQLAGVPKREILDFLSCCRLRCPAKRQPFSECHFCQEKSA